MPDYRITPYQTQYLAWVLSRQIGRDSPDLLASTLVDARVDLNPHQVEAALFAFRSPLSQGAILAEEVGLGNTVEASLVGGQEDCPLVAGVTDTGQALHEEGAHELLRLPAQVQEANLFMEPPAELAEDVERQERAQIETVNTRKLGYFDAEVQKLDAWADDLKVCLENEVKELNREIKDVRRTATVAATLEEKLHRQRRRRELEDKRIPLRRRIVDRQNEIDQQRSGLIAAVEERLSVHASVRKIFAVQWALV